MPENKPGIYGLDSLYLFPYHQTREDYQRSTGAEPPAFNPSRPPKYWFDPKARESLRRTVVYENVLAVSQTGSALVGDDGKPYLEPLMLNKDEAAAVNIPPKGPTISNIPGADVPEVPPPVRSLADDEELAFGFAGTVSVRTKRFEEERDVFTAADRALLKAIAAKLGI